jgi:ATP-binding cassette, subfamily B, bacterial
VTEGTNRTSAQAWGDRIQALKNVPAVLKIVWNSGPWVVALGLLFRILVSVVPLAALVVSKKIIDHIQEISNGKAHLQGSSDYLWKLVALEFVLVVAVGVFSRIIDYYDRVLADRYTRHVSIQVMQQASALDLQAYENPAYYDRLERARVQATDRLAMIQAMGRLFQQAITTITFSAAIFYYSPLLLGVLVVCLIPAFLGESHFAFLNYALNFRQTPVKRELDYIRQVGGSKEAAKELKLFGLSDFLTDRFTRLSDQVLAENLALSRRRLLAATPLSILSTAGYYASYVWIIYRTAIGRASYGDFVLLTAAVTNAQSNISQLFSTLSGIADQALFLTDLLAFFDMKPTVLSKASALPAPRPIRKGFEFKNVSFKYPGTERLILDNLNFSLEPGERIALIGQNGQGNTT